MPVIEKQFQSARTSTGLHGGTKGGAGPKKETARIGAASEPTPAIKRN